jgi:hypothetical protein
MKTRFLTTLILLAAGAAPPLAAADFVVVAVTGALAPDGLSAGQQLSEKTRLGLEPWGRALVRETTKCGLTQLIVGVSDYPLSLSEDCAATDEPGGVAARIQQGEVFAARVKETGSGLADDLVLALSHDPCVYLPRVSEEGDSSRHCPSGYALNGLRCTGSFCDNKDLMCCPYLGGGPDPSAKEVSSRAISEEFPNSMTSKRFLNGLACGGSYCDNVTPHPFKSSRLASGKACDWSAWASERPMSWLVCGGAQFVAGIRCRGDYCADVGLYCCEALVE